VRGQGSGIAVERGVEPQGRKLRIFERTQAAQVPDQCPQREGNWVETQFGVELHSGRERHVEILATGSIVQQQRPTFGRTTAQPGRAGTESALVRGVLGQDLPAVRHGWLRQYVLLRHGPYYLGANVALQGWRQAIEQAVSVAEHIDRGELTAQLFFPLWMERLEAQAGDPAQARRQAAGLGVDHARGNRFPIGRTALAYRGKAVARQVFEPGLQFGQALDDVLFVFVFAFARLCRSVGCFFRRLRS
jgi:hypothetical protein